MAERCPKCKQKLQGSDFLCPHCGHILGQAVPEEPRKKKERKLPWRQIFSITGVVLLIAALAVGAWLIGTLDRNTETTAPTTVPTELPTTAAPLVAYELQVRNAQMRAMAGLTVEVFQGSELVYTYQTDLQGKVSMILPQQEGYYVKLSDMPMPYAHTYRDTQFSFPSGQQELHLQLEEQPVPYTVTVVDKAGKPLRGAAIMFLGAFASVSDENGQCVIMTMYMENGVFVDILTPPTGYYADDENIFFPDGSTELTIVLDSCEDVPLNADQQLYTLQVTDEFGDPVRDAQLYILHDLSHEDALIWDILTTNSDGWTVFIGQKDMQYWANYAQHPDYSLTFFPFEEGSSHLQIGLELHKTEFTYSVRFTDQFGDPVPGVQIRVTTPIDGHSMLTSDADGNFSFVSKESDPTKVEVTVVDVPEGYSLESSENLFRFYVYSRAMDIQLYNKNVTVEVSVIDNVRKPVEGASVYVWIGDGEHILLTTDKDGYASTTLYLEREQFENLDMDLHSLPKDYAGFWVYYYEYASETFMIIHIGPPSDSPIPC